MQKSEQYMKDLKKWLQDTADTSLEEMSDFFTKRLYDYEEHMSVWENSYRIFAEMLSLELDEKVRQGGRDGNFTGGKVLDLGCGTGLELDQIWKKNPDIEVTGVDLCQSMLDKLLEKHSDKHFTAVCQDYFQYDFGCGKWDAVISFESFHHFLPERKKELYRKIRNSLKEDGIFVLGDYIADSGREEELLRSVYLEKRKRFGVPEHQFVHFDIPLTLEHETDVLRSAGFVIEKVREEPDGVTIIMAGKGT